MLLAANNYILFVLCNGFEYTRTVLVKKVARSEPMGPLVISQPRDLHLGPTLEEILPQSEVPGHSNDYFLFHSTGFPD